MVVSYAVPGVYYEPRPRAAPRPLARTDVVGFVGFEPRLRDGATPCQLSGTPPQGHAFQVDVTGFQLPVGTLGPSRVVVPAATDLLLSASTTTIPVAAGGAIAYAVVAVLTDAGSVQLQVVSGPASPTDRAAVADDQTIDALAAGRPWVRIADVHVRRSSDGLQVFPTVVPALPPTRCDDWSDFVLQLGGIPADDDGTLLARCVRAYFANGGARCHVATIRRPRFDDIEGLRQALDDLVGVAGSSQAEATGLERLLLITEVAVVDTPDLYARNVEPLAQPFDLPPRDLEACFRPCDTTLGVHVATRASGARRTLGPLFADDDVRRAQRAMLERCAPERWRVLLLLAAPVDLDPATGVFAGRTAEGAMEWRTKLDQPPLDPLGASCGAFYHPWVLCQEKLGAPIVELPPTSLAAGVIARRDLARGPHIAPANERLVGVVGLSPAVDEATNAAIYPSPLHINPLRAMPGQGVLVWGARTLSQDPWLRYLPVRRCLSAIERRALVALQPLVFEPNTPTLWFQITQVMLGMLVPIFEAGALRGDTPEQAFYVRCDGTNNPPEAIEVGQVLCEVGVAIAAPAEFLVFRVGRREAVVEVIE